MYHESTIRVWRLEFRVQSEQHTGSRRGHKHRLLSSSFDPKYKPQKGTIMEPMGRHKGAIRVLSTSCKGALRVQLGFAVSGVG